MITSMQERPPYTALWSETSVPKPVPNKLRLGLAISCSWLQQINRSRRPKSRDRCCLLVVAKELRSVRGMSHLSMQDVTAGRQVNYIVEIDISSRAKHYLRAVQRPPNSQKSFTFPTATSTTPQRKKHSSARTLPLALASVFSVALPIVNHVPGSRWLYTL